MCPEAGGGQRGPALHPSKSLWLPELQHKEGFEGERLQAGLGKTAGKGEGWDRSQTGLGHPESLSSFLCSAPALLECPQHKGGDKNPVWWRMKTGALKPLMIYALIRCLGHAKGTEHRGICHLHRLGLAWGHLSVLCVTGVSLGLPLGLSLALSLHPVPCQRCHLCGHPATRVSPPVSPGQPGEPPQPPNSASPARLSRGVK